MREQAVVLALVGMGKVAAVDASVFATILSTVSGSILMIYPFNLFR